MTVVFPGEGPWMGVDPFVAPTIDDVFAARERIAPYIASTPSILAGDLAYKLEFFQHTVSFKERRQPRFGCSVRWCGAHIPARIVMRATTPDYIVDAARAYGATVELPPTIADAFARMHELAEGGMTVLHPFDDAHMMGGAATVALDMLNSYRECSARSLRSAVGD